jgi:glyoxylase-like metal-dependent hydrolase (beta-lactamase superfamily II)
LNALKILITFSIKDLYIMKFLRIAILASILSSGFATAQVNTRLEQVTAAPVPATAMGQKIDQSKGYFVEEIKKGSGAYWVTEGSFQAMFLTTGKGVVVVDAPPILGDKILKAIAEVTKEPVMYLIYSHAHPDHITGAHHFPKGIKVIATKEIAKSIERAQVSARSIPFGTFVGGKPGPLVNTIVKPGDTLRIGNQTLKFHKLPTAHSHVDMAVELPKHSILMAVDVIWPGWVPFERLGAAEDVGGYIAIHKFLLDLKWDVMVSGHMARLTTRQDVEVNRAYVSDLMSAVTSALQSTDYMAAAKRTGFSNTFLTIETYFDMVAKTASDEVEKKWQGKLGGVDIWTYSNARAAAMWLRLN